MLKENLQLQFKGNLTFLTSLVFCKFFVLAKYFVNNNQELYRLIPQTQAS